MTRSETWMRNPRSVEHISSALGAGAMVSLKTPANYRTGMLHRNATTADARAAERSTRPNPVRLPAPRSRCSKENGAIGCNGPFNVRANSLRVSAFRTQGIAVQVWFSLLTHGGGGQQQMLMSGLPCKRRA
jgi:hypothetical protein